MLIVHLLKHISIYNKAKRWAKKYSLINSHIVLPLFLGVLLSYPKGNSNELLALFKLSTFIVVIDDVYDNNLFRTKNMFNLLEKTEPISFTHPYKKQLHVLYNDIKNSFFEHIKENDRHLFVSSVGDIINAMTIEMNVNSFNTVNQYLSISKKSVGLYMYNTALAMIMGINLNREKTTIMRVIEYSSIFIRLSNDVRSYQKEIKEKKINSVGILVKKGMSDKEATKKIHDYSVKNYNIVFNTKIKDKNVDVFRKNVLRYIDYIDRFYKYDDFRESIIYRLFTILFMPVYMFGQEKK